MRRHRFLCFGLSAGVVVGDDDDDDHEMTISRTSRQRRSRRFVPRIASLLLLRRRSDPVCSRFREAPLPELFLKLRDDEDRMSSEPVFTSSSSTSSSSSSSSSSLFSSASSEVAATVGRRRMPPRPAETEDDAKAPVKWMYNRAVCLCFLLLSLLVLVFGGRVFAIVWTSAWLCLAPRQYIGGRSTAAAAAAVEVKERGWSEGEKQRVVLEGLLERNRKV